MNRTLDLLWLRIREYFHHPAEDIRQARPIVPGRLYKNFGYVCKAVPYTRHERNKIEKIRQEKQGEASGVLASLLMEEATGGKVNGGFSAMNDEIANLNTLNDGCFFCDFHRKCIPCPMWNELKDGSTVCDTHKYVILKNQH